MDALHLAIGVRQRARGVILIVANTAQAIAQIGAGLFKTERGQLHRSELSLTVSHRAGVVQHVQKGRFAQQQQMERGVVILVEGELGQQAEGIVAKFMGAVDNEHHRAGLAVQRSEIALQRCLEIGESGLLGKIQHEGLEHILQKLTWRGEQRGTDAGYHLIAVCMPGKEVTQSSLAAASRAGQRHDVFALARQQLHLIEARATHGAGEQAVQRGIRCKGVGCQPQVRQSLIQISHRCSFASSVCSSSAASMPLSMTACPSPRIRMNRILPPTTFLSKDISCR